MRYPAAVLTVGVVALASAQVITAEAWAAPPEIMMAQCRARAGSALKMRLPDIDTKYEGQRTDGTHAVNGTAFAATGSRRTFQCSFNRSGSRIIRFVVNPVSASDAKRPAAAPATSSRTVNRTETIRFAPGKSNTSIKGSIRGDQSISYVLGAEAGQAMAVTLKPSNLATYFNIYVPGKGPGDQALVNSGTTPELNKFSGKLSASGEYTISVYMMRSAARRKERSDFTMDVSISALSGGVSPSAVQNDFADGLQGGPDYWEVRVDGPSKATEIRASASSSSSVLGEVADRMVVRNLGCRMAEGRRWCRIEGVGGANASGWVIGEYLRESSYAGAPATNPDTQPTSK